MQSPFTGGETLLKENSQLLSYHDQIVSVQVIFYECLDTHQTFTTEAVDEVNMSRLCQAANKISKP